MTLALTVTPLVAPAGPPAGSDPPADLGDLLLRLVSDGSTLVQRVPGRGSGLVSVFPDVSDVGSVGWVDPVAVVAEG